jgi:hypothetical protein
MPTDEFSAFVRQVKQFTFKMNSLEAIDERMAISHTIARE